MKATKRKQNKVKAVPSTMASPSKAIRQELSSFIEYHPAKRFNRNLRNLLVEFLMYDGAIEASYLPDLLYDIEGLFQLLDVIQEETVIT